MFKTISICATVVVLGTAAANAQQREAVLHEIDMPNADFDVVLIMAKPGSPTFNLRGQPDPGLLYLMGGELVYANTDELQRVLKNIIAVELPVCAFYAEPSGSKPRNPVSVFVVPKRKAPTAIRMASLNIPKPEPIMHKLEVPGGALDIVFSTTKTPVALNPNEPLDYLVVHSIGTEFAMATAGEVEKMFRDVGYTELPACAFEVEHKDSNPPQAVSVYIFPKH